MPGKRLPWDKQMVTNRLGPGRALPAGLHRQGLGKGLSHKRNKRNESLLLETFWVPAEGRSPKAQSHPGSGDKWPRRAPTSALRTALGQAAAAPHCHPAAAAPPPLPLPELLPHLQTARPRLGAAGELSPRFQICSPIRGEPGLSLNPSGGRLKPQNLRERSRNNIKDNNWGL